MLLLEQRTDYDPLRARGLRVPEDVAVVGYDDLEPAAWADPALTTVRQDVQEMGRMIAGLLMRCLNGQGPGKETDEAPPAPVITPARLVIRAST